MDTASATDSRGLQERVREAAERKTPLRILGGDTKRFYGRNSGGEPLDLSGHSGIVSYEPSELVITARAGTRLSEVRQTLDEAGQMLAFEPPAFGGDATLGGTIACGLSGPRRATAGSARDFVLGVNLIDGRGDWLQFGGQVMKNVAGYDVARLNTGAFGTLGVLTEISLKVLPKPETEITRILELDTATAIDTVNRLAGKSLPLSASCHHAGKLHLRLSGNISAVNQASEAIGGDACLDNGFWDALAEQQTEFFRTPVLWRLSLPPATPPLPITGDTLIEWGGAQRWINSEQSAGEIFRLCANSGGHATLFRGGDRDGPVFQPLPKGLTRLHKDLKAQFDPAGILNPGRMYAE